MLLASNERFESVTAGERKEKEKRKVVARHHHSQVVVRQEERLYVCTQTMHSICTKTYKSSVQQPTSQCFLLRFSFSPVCLCVFLPSFAFKFRRTYINLFFFMHRSIDTRTSNRAFCRQRSSISLFLSYSSSHRATKNRQTPFTFLC